MNQDMLKKAAETLHNVVLVDSDVKLYMSLSSNQAKRYEVHEFDLAFSQPTDPKGQPQQEINGGVIEFSITELPDSTINKWMMDPVMQMSGEFIFERSGQNSVLKVTFTDSYCVRYHKTVGMGGTLTRLCISPESVDVNGHEKLKIWAR